MGCGRCIEICPKKAITLNEQGISTERVWCDGCGQCIEVCLSEAREIAGKFFTAREVLEIVEKDTLFYRNSGGGVTLSGGEPFMQPLFARTLLQLCQESGFHTAVETCGAVPWKNIAQGLEFVDLFLYDIKHSNPLLHRKTIGGTNRLILNNLRKITEKGIETVLRVPIIPGFNATTEEIGAITDLAKTLDGIKEINLLPYHRLGKQKYERLERPYAWKEDTSSEGLIGELLEVVRSRGLEGSIG